MIALGSADLIRPRLPSTHTVFPQAHRAIRRSCQGLHASGQYHRGTALVVHHS